MTFTNLEKYVYSKKCLKKTTSTSPTPPPSKVEGIFTPKSHLTIEEQSLEDGKLQIFFLIAKIISLLIIIIKKKKKKKKKVLFTDGLCHIMWFSIGHCIKTKNYSTKNDKILK